MKVGIVGSEAAKFTSKGQAAADEAIWKILDDPKVTHVVSGACHLGGIDIWAENIGEELGKIPEIYPPKNLAWATGYKPRNLQIAKASDIVYCISVDSLPTDYKGMKFAYCYHCTKVGRSGIDHVKSGGCWTVIEGMKLGKEGRWITVSNS